MNPTLFEGTNETVPLKPTPTSSSRLKIAEIGRLFTTTYFLLSTLIASIIPIIQLSIGWYYRGTCPIDQRIPTYMIVAGICGLIFVGLSICLFIIFKCFIPESASLTVFATFTVGLNLVATFLLSIFVFIWFIIGCVWVFSVRHRVQFVDRSKDDYCQPVLYKWSFAILILTIFWALLQCCLSCFRKCCVGQSPQ